MFFMLTLVLAGNYLLMFIGWEGVGLASYLLIGFWFTKDSAAAAGKKAFIVNRIGDFGFLIALFLLIKHFGSLNFDSVFGAISSMPAETAGAGLLTAIGILLMVGACGKSAQIPLYVWLPDAMEGPTPVSALIHAATMVTAGVYMVSRSHLIFERAPSALTVVAIIGTLTAFFAATIAIAQTDIKKVLAYSTISQLGYMFMACGVGAFSAGIFHLMTHAFFKGLLFLAAGSVIHALGGEQDMRKMGGLRTKIPWTFWTMGIGDVGDRRNSAIRGIFQQRRNFVEALPGELDLLAGRSRHRVHDFVLHVPAVVHDFLRRVSREEAESTGMHARRSRRRIAHGHGGMHESPKVMLVPLVILAVLSIIGGYVGVPGSLGGNNRFEKFLGPVFHGSLGEADPWARRWTSRRRIRAEDGGMTELMFTGISVVRGLPRPRVWRGCLYIAIRSCRKRLRLICGRIPDAVCTSITSTRSTEFCS